MSAMDEAEAYDWGSFDIYFYYDAPLLRVWDSWTTANGLCSFLLERCTSTDEAGNPIDETVTFVADGRYHWGWRQGIELEGRYLAVEPEKHVAFTFGSMRVDVRFDDTESGVRVHLHQSAIGPTDANRVGGHLNCRSCWIFFMTNLVSVLTTGVDLRHGDAERVSSMEVGFVPAE